MNIPIQEVQKSEKITRTSKGHAWIYLKALEDDPSAIPDLLANIDNSTRIDEDGNRCIWVRAVDMAEALGPYFVKNGTTALHWGMKFALFLKGIWLSTTTRHTQIDPKTNKPYLMFILRRSKAGDTLSPEQSKHLPPGFKAEPFSNKIVPMEPGDEEEGLPWQFRQDSIDINQMID